MALDAEVSHRMDTETLVFGLCIAIGCGTHYFRK